MVIICKSCKKVIMRNCKKVTCLNGEVHRYHRECFLKRGKSRVKKVKQRSNYYASQMNATPSRERVTGVDQTILGHRQ